MTNASAQMVEPVIVATDSDSYVEGDMISVNGRVLQKHQGDLSVRVIAPSGNIVALNQISIGFDNTFSFNIATGGLMKESGVYTIEANYSLDARSPRLATTTFMFTAVDTPGIMVDGTEFEPLFHIDGGAVLGMHTVPDGNTLVIEIDSSSDGHLSITLPRDLIDSVLADGSDDSFFVLVGGEEVQYVESATDDDSRTLEIDFFGGAGLIEIIGTSVAVPEFGTIAALVLAASIISIVAVSARSRLSLVPRF